MEKRPGAKYSVRCSADDVKLFEKNAEEEGFSSVPQWMLAVCRRHAKKTEDEPRIGELYEALKKWISEKEGQ